MADQEDASTEDAKPPSPKDVVKVLAELGYVYKVPEGGTVSDERLTQVDDETKGFEWKGQENYDAVAAACALYCKTRLVLASGLMETALGEARCWAHPNDAGPNAPIIFLVCGSFPGGSAGVWGRSLCVNATLREGGMFDYIERFRNELGANVVVADPNVSEEAGRIVAGSETPHRHLSTLYSRAIHKDETRPIAIVAHSYGASAVAFLFKDKPQCRSRIKAVALTDGCALYGSILKEEVPPSGSARLEHNKKYAPSAFEDDAEAGAAYAAVARNFVSSSEPAGTPLPGRGPFESVSAGHTSHPATTHAATEEVFAFLKEKLAK